MADRQGPITDPAVEAFLASVEPPARREEARVLDALFRRATGEAPRMWGAIVGYGEYRTTYASGRKVHAMRSGFSPKKAKHSLYLMSAYCDPAAAAERAAILARLGRYSEGKSCLYLASLARIDLAALEELVAADWQAMLRIYPDS